MNSDFGIAIARELSKGREIHISTKEYIGGAVDVEVTLAKPTGWAKWKSVRISARDFYEFGLDGAYANALKRASHELDKE